jgi:hypothetical protein
MAGDNTFYEFEESDESKKNDTEFPVLPIEELPEEYKKLYKEFQEHLHNRNPKEARLSLRPLIAHYIKLKREIPVSIEVGYGKLLVLEELEKTKTS